MKVKLFTHTDLDGCGCGIVANVAFGKDNVSIEYCDYSEINQKLTYFIDSKGYEKYDRIFITDISFNEEVAEKLNSVYLGGTTKVQLVDHHATALWLAEKYPMWCEVRVEESNLYPNDEIIFTGEKREKVKSSGTSLFYKFLRNKNIPKIERNPKLKSFAEMVRQYDSWEWSTYYHNNHPKRLNDLLYLIGREKFIDRFTCNPIPTFTDTELTLLEIEEHRINKYIWYKKKDVKLATIEVNNKNYNVAYVFAEQNTSLLGNAIAEEYGDKIDFVVIVDAGNNKVSLRGKHDYIALGSDIAKFYGGGGHPKASGFEISDEYTEDLFYRIFQGGN